MDIAQLLSTTTAQEASDLHLKPGAPPVLRIHGHLVPIEGIPPLTPDQLTAIFKALTSEAQQAHFIEARELDFSFGGMDEARFRINASVQRGQMSLAFRRIPMQIPTLDELSLPPLCRELATKRQGLILVTGPTGCGKSTTLAAMIDHLNALEAKRIITIEDPVEFVYRDRLAFITQRELGRDTRSFAVATRQALRQDPDCILVGEMRDLETMAACLTAAETGHLVLSTLHTNSAAQTIDRLVDSFPPHQQGQIRMQVSLTLVAVLTQALLPRLDGGGRIPAFEIMIANNAIRNLIREGKTHQMESVIQTNREAGMQTMEQALEGLYRQGLISLDTALLFSNDTAALQMQLSPG